MDEASDILKKLRNGVWGALKDAVYGCFDRDGIKSPSLPCAERKFYDIIKAYTDAFRPSAVNSRDTNVKLLPSGLALPFELSVDRLEDELLKALSAELTACANEKLSADETAERICGCFEDRTARFDSTVDAFYKHAAWYLLLSGGDPDEQRFVFVAEASDSTCDSCKSYDGKLFSLNELVEWRLLPPLHKNCRCRIVPVTDKRPSSVAESPYGGADPAKTRGLLDYIFSTVAGWPRDIMEMAGANASRYDEEQRMLERRVGRIPADILTSFDWLTLGIVGGLSERASAMLNDPSFFNIANWLTLGFAQTLKNTFAPERPLSLQHILSSVSTAGVVYGMYGAAQSAAAVRNAPPVYGDHEVFPAWPREQNGLFGVKGPPKGGRHVRHLPGGLDEANRFWEYYTDGYKTELPLKNGHGIKRILSDGSEVIFRPTYSSDGTPVIEFKNHHSIPYQKIHFVD